DLSTKTDQGTCRTPSSPLPGRCSPVRMPVDPSLVIARRHNSHERAFETLVEKHKHGNKLLPNKVRSTGQRNHQPQCTALQSIQKAVSCRVLLTSACLRNALCLERLLRYQLSAYLAKVIPMAHPFRHANILDATHP